MTACDQVSSLHDSSLAEEARLSQDWKLVHVCSLHCLELVLLIPRPYIHICSAIRRFT